MDNDTNSEFRKEFAKIHGNLLFTKTREIEIDGDIGYETLGVDKDEHDYNRLKELLKMHYKSYRIVTPEDGPVDMDDPSRMTVRILPTNKSGIYKIGSAQMG